MNANDEYMQQSFPDQSIALSNYTAPNNNFHGNRQFRDNEYYNHQYMQHHNDNQYPYQYHYVNNNQHPNHYNNHYDYNPYRTDNHQQNPRSQDHIHSKGLCNTASQTTFASLCPIF